MSASSTDPPDLKPSDTPDEATLPQTSNDEVPTVKHMEHLHHSQGEGNKPRDVGELRTPTSESPKTKDGYTVSEPNNATQVTNKVPITASEDLDVIATLDVEHTKKTNNKKVEGQKKKEGGEKGENRTEDMRTVKEGKDGREVNEEGEAKIDIKSEEKTDGATDSESSLSTIDSDDLDELAWIPGKPEDIVAKHQECSAKYARVTGAYVEGLEARVGMLESHVRKLQTLVDLKKPSEGIKVDSAASNSASVESSVLDGPCDDNQPIKIMRLTVKDFKTKDWRQRCREACVLLGFAAGSKFPQAEPVRPLAQPGSAIRPHVDVADGYTIPNPQSDMVHPNVTEVERFACTSPWLVIIIQLLSGEIIEWDKVWIYPFKHLVVYHKQIRQFIKLLEEVDLDSLKARDMLQTLKTTISQIASDSGPKRVDYEYSDTNIERIMGALAHWFPRHSQKMQQSFSHADKEKGEETKLAAEAFNERPERVEVGETGSNNADTSGGCKKSMEELERRHPDPTCTCLRSAREHLKLVIEVIDGDLAGLMTLRQAISDRSLRKIRFKDLWNLFQPGDLVVTSKRPHQAFRIIFVSGGRPLMTSATAILVDENNNSADLQDVNRRSKVSPFRIDCVRFDFDGKNYGPVQEEVDINHYDEEKEIVELEVYPIRFADDEMGLRQHLMKRGEHFTTYREFKHKWHAGVSLSGRLQEIESEVIIDFAEALRQQPHLKVDMGLSGLSYSDVRESYEDICMSHQCLKVNHNWIVDDELIDELRKEYYINLKSGGMFEGTRDSTQALSEDQLILLPFRVHGYTLRTRYWAELNIECVTDIQQYDTPDSKDAGFEDLVIPEEYKRTVKALVRSHALGQLDPNSQQVDLIRGKGKGLVILLHGVPGVGKTSTAESVAAYAKKPLFLITSGDIGQTAHDVDSNLGRYFHAARRWGCILLIDEADVFLEKRDRSGSSIERNALVSVFLRALEYYSGILFLTTNRVGTFDEAFISRIHMSLYYGDLDQDYTHRIWLMHIDRFKRPGRNLYVHEDEIRAFARDHWRDGHRWNGRQIRNAFHTALALAEYDFHEDCIMCEETGDKPPSKPKLLAKHFKAVAQTSAEFDNFLTSVFGGMSHKDKARVAELRNDEWQDRGVETPAGKKFPIERAVRPKASLVGGSGMVYTREQTSPGTSLHKAAIPRNVPEDRGLETNKEEEGSPRSEEVSKMSQEETFKRFMQWQELQGKAQ